MVIVKFNIYYVSRGLLLWSINQISIYENLAFDVSWAIFVKKMWIDCRSHFLGIKVNNTFKSRLLISIRTTMK